MNKVVAATLALALAGVMGTAQAGDAAAGQAKSAMCAGCHGPDGNSMVPMYPNLAGQKEAYIVKQLKAFRDGSRVDPVMAPMAKPLSDADIDNLAAYFSSQHQK